MTSSPISTSLTTTFIVLSLLGPIVSTERYTFDIEIRYFTDGHLTCDHPLLNITKMDNVQALYWIFEDGSLVTPNMYLNPKKYLLQGLPEGVSGASQPSSRYDGYNLTVLEVNDDVFGYYTCIVLFTADPQGTPTIAAIRYGLNVDGADFSELVEEYKHNAMVGGIAAGVVLVIIGVACFIWYTWCKETGDEDTEDLVLDGVETEAKGKMGDNGMTSSHHNEAFKEDKEGIDNVKSNGSESNSRL